MKTQDWKRFRKRVYLKAQPEEIFRAWTTSEGITKWFVREATFQSESGRSRSPGEVAQPEDSYLWQYMSPGEESGKILTVEPSSYLRFTFGRDDVPVTVTLKRLGDLTRVELTQENMPDTEEGRVSWHLGCSVGWTFFLANLKSVLDYGVDLRDHDPARAAESIPCGLE